MIYNLFFSKIYQVEILGINYPTKNPIVNFEIRFYNNVPKGKWNTLLKFHVKQTIFDLPVDLLRIHKHFRLLFFLALHSQLSPCFSPSLSFSFFFSPNGPHTTLMYMLLCVYIYISIYIYIYYYYFYLCSGFNATFSHFFIFSFSLLQILKHISIFQKLNSS